MKTSLLAMSGACALVLAFAACSGETISADAGADTGTGKDSGGGTDAAPTDAAPEAALDAGTAPDADGGNRSCTGPQDCELRSSYCGGCTCVPQPKGTKTPGCDAGMVMCIVDPCQGKTAACTGGVCALQ
jgi:hypothetical protein